MLELISRPLVASEIYTPSLPEVERIGRVLNQMLAVNFRFAGKDGIFSSLRLMG